MSSSPELWATGKLYREECVSAGGLEGLWGVGDGHGVRGCRDTVCCLRCFCNEPLRFREKGSSGGRHNTSSMQEWLLNVRRKKNVTSGKKKNHVIYDFIQHKTEQEGHTQTGLLYGVGCRWCRAVDPPSDCQRWPAPAFFEPAPHPDLHPHHHPPM